MDFTTAVKKRMKQKGLNGYDLAARIGYSPSSVYRVLRGDRRWTQKSISLVCDALDLKVEVIPNDSKDLQAG